MNTGFSHHIKKVGICKKELSVGGCFQQFKVLTQRVATAQLRLLGIFGRQLITDTIQQLNITLLRVLAQSGDERPRHGTSSLSGDLGILTGLAVLTARPHDDIRRAGLSRLGTLVRLIPLGGFLEEAHGRGHHATHIAARVRRHHPEQALTGLLSQVRLLEHTRGGVDVGKIQRGAGVTRVENRRQAHTGTQRPNHDPVHLIVDNVACNAEIHRVDYFVIAIVLVTIKIGCLTAVACSCVSLS